MLYPGDGTGNLISHSVARICAICECILSRDCDQETVIIRVLLDVNRKVAVLNYWCPYNLRTDTMPNIQAINAAHYTLPNCPEYQWWLPPPCMAPCRKKYRRRFCKLVNYMISKGLQEAELPYEILSIEIHYKPCRNLTQCVYNLRVSLGNNYQLIADGKRALHDLRMFRPRGIQEVSLIAGSSELPGDDSPSSSDSSSEEPKPMIVEVTYTPNCQHNVRFRGNCRVQHQRMPKVRIH